MHKEIMIQASRLAALCLVLLSGELAHGQKLVSEDKILGVMRQELSREMDALGKQPVPPYYISYSIGDEQTVTMISSFGAITKHDSSRRRMLLVDLRVGDHQLDNTRQIRGSRDFFSNGMAQGGSRAIAFENSELALRQAMWRETDQSYKAAVERLQQVRTNQAVKVTAEDTSGDFSRADADHKYYEAPIEMSSYFTNRGEWEARLKKYSGLFAGRSNVMEAKASLTSSVVRKYFVSTEGGEIASNEVYVRVMVQGMVKAADGMELPLYKSYFAFTPGDLPNDEEIQRDVNEMIATLEQMRTAPIVDPYTGPAILSGGASGVFFHEIFGHRVEGHRQKNEDEGQTFKKKVNERILPSFIDVYFDPNQEKYRGQDLLGKYKFDDEGVKGQRVDVVKNGILQAFLMTRSPIEGFSNSNGHARAMPGRRPVARQSNLVVDAKETVSVDKLRAQLIDLCKKQNKPYGLWFKQVEGGFTLTGRTIPNSFNVLPILVYRV
ncbi:MAG TPA: metallopeptidase TldD-related protein, partial [Candidatus Kapabacteria bacterium]|nr:metallopeptidase TldD-related protein [Candidatus Kapabacteria bacterium]